MPDAVMIREQVEARIAELEEVLEPLRTEYDRLKIVAQTFADGDGGAAAVRAPARNSSRAAAPAAARAGSVSKAATDGGGRAQQAIKLITTEPGISASDLAKAMGISRNYLYRVLPKLERRGTVVKQGKGYRMASAPAEG